MGNNPRENERTASKMRTLYNALRSNFRRSPRDCSSSAPGLEHDYVVRETTQQGVDRPGGRGNRRSCCLFCAPVRNNRENSLPLFEWGLCCQIPHKCNGKSLEWAGSVTGEVVLCSGLMDSGRDHRRYTEPRLIIISQCTPHHGHALVTYTHQHSTVQHSTFNIQLNL